MRASGCCRAFPTSNAATKHTIVAASGSRVLLLGIFGLGLVYQFLLLLVLVLVVLGLLRGRNGTLVREAVEDTDGKGGPPQNLDMIGLETDILNW